MLMPSEMESFGLAGTRSHGLQRPHHRHRVGGVPELNS